MFKLATTLSLLAFVGAVVLWLSSRNAYCGLSFVDASKPEDACWIEGLAYRSKFGLVSLRYRAGMTEIESFASKGRHLRPTWRDEPPIMASGAVDLAEIGLVDWKFAGLSYSHEPGGIWCIIIPVWLSLAAFGILPVSWLTLAYIRRRRRQADLCPACSYSLTGNTSGVCPECGTAVAEKGREVL